VAEGLLSTDLAGVCGTASTSAGARQPAQEGRDRRRKSGERRPSENGKAAEAVRQEQPSLESEPEAKLEPGPSEHEIDSFA